MNDNQEINLTELAEGLPAITPAFGAALAEACAICLEDQGHLQGVELEVDGDFNTRFKLRWGTTSEQMLRCWNDQEYTTEQAAYGIAFMLVQKLTDFTVIERARRGAGFDYWLGTQTLDEQLFHNKARLEVSGIRKGDQSRINARVKQKLEQVAPLNKTLPAYIVVVEFGNPLSLMVQR